MPPRGSAYRPLVLAYRPLVLLLTLNLATSVQSKSTVGCLDSVMDSRGVIRSDTTPTHRCDPSRRRTRALQVGCRLDRPGLQSAIHVSCHDAIVVAANVQLLER